MLSFTEANSSWNITFKLLDFFHNVTVMLKLRFFKDEHKHVLTQIVDVEKLSSLTQCVSDLKEKVQKRESVHCWHCSCDWGERLSILEFSHRFINNFWHVSNCHIYFSVWPRKFHQITNQLLRLDKVLVDFKSLWSLPICNKWKHECMQKIVRRRFAGPEKPLQSGILHVLKRQDQNFVTVMSYPPTSTSLQCLKKISSVVRCANL